MPGTWGGVGGPPPVREDRAGPVPAGEDSSRVALVLVDTNPTMELWAAEIEELRERLGRLGFRPVMVRPLDLRAGVAALPGHELVVVVSDGASGIGQSPPAVRLLRALGQVRPTVVVHLLSRTQWYRTGINPDPVLLRTAAGAANVLWSWQSSGPSLTGERDDAIAVPVLEHTPRGIDVLARLIRGGDDQVPVAGLLLDDSEPDGEPGSVRPATADAKTSVSDFRASVSPTTFRLATYLAAVPLDLSVMRDIQERLMPRSTPGNLSEILISSLVRTQEARLAGLPGGRAAVEKPLSVRFTFVAGVREQLLASARHSDLQRVVRAVAERRAGAPGVSSFVSVFDDPPTPMPPPEDADPARLGEELAWRRARAQVLLALGGSHHRQAVTELKSLESVASSGEPPDDRSTRSSEHPDREPRPVGGRPVSSKAQDPRLPAVETDSPAVKARHGRWAILGNYPLRNPNFTGRGDLLGEMDESLRAGTTAVLPHALHGMGGVGKSLLAIEYIYVHQDDYDVIWWVPSEQTSRVQRSLLELGKRLGLDVGDEANTGVPIVLDALRHGEPYENWLLVFDNAESPESLLPYLPRGGTGRVLITSRDARWSQVARPLEVNVFKREESKELLRQRAPSITDEEADRLAEALGDLPLAIEQAAAWHAETGMPAQEYLRLLREKQIQLLDQAPPLDYQVPVIAAWNVSLDRLEARSRAALELLQVSSFFAAEPIPRTLFTAARAQDLSPELNRVLRDPIQFARALRDISRYSLARLDHRTNAIHVHRLVQAALVARMSDEQRQAMRRAAHRILAANDPLDPENPEQYDTYNNLFPHVLASDAVSAQEPWVRSLVVNEAKSLYRWGDHAASLELCRTAYEAWSSVLGDDDPQTLEIARWLGWVLFATGRFAEAAELNEHTLGVYRRLERSGRAEPEGELETLRNVAIDRRAQGEFADALGIAGEVYQRSLTAYGGSVPETLNAAHNLAVSLRLTGDFARARDLDQDTLERKVEVFGPDHPLTLITHLGLLIDLRELGDYVDVVGKHEIELERARLALGDLSPYTLLARRLLAVAQRKAGLHEQARATSELVRRQLRARYYARHPDVVAADSNYAIDLRQVGDLEQSRQLGSEIVERYAAALGADHPHTLSAQVNLAITHRLLGEVSKALDLDLAAYEALARQLGPDHPSTLVAGTNLGSDLQAVGEPGQALERDEDAWRRLVGVFGVEHPTTLMCESNLAIDLRKLDRLDEARERHHHAVTALRAHLGDQHPAALVAASWDARADCDLDPMPL